VRYNRSESEKFMKKEDVPSGRAIAIQQPYAEWILTGEKKFEYRSRQTHIRGRVFVYASKTPGHEDDWEEMGKQPGDLPTGVIIGSVEVVDCEWFPKYKSFGYKLKNPKRYKKALKPKNQAQPCWFFPFGVVKGRPKFKK